MPETDKVIDKKVQLRIITPEKCKVDEKTDMVIMRCTTGDLGVLYGHEPLTAVLDTGILRIINNKEMRVMAIFGGLAEIHENTVTILTNMAEWPEDIDRARAEADREQAELQLKSSHDDVEIRKDQINLRRSLVRLEVSSYPLINKAADWSEGE